MPLVLFQTVQWRISSRRKHPFGAGAIDLMGQPRVTRNECLGTGFDSDYLVLETNQEWGLGIGSGLPVCWGWLFLCGTQDNAIRGHELGRVQ